MLITNNSAFGTLYYLISQAKPADTLDTVLKRAIKESDTKINHLSDSLLDASLNSFYCESVIDDYMPPSTGMLACADLLNHYHKLSDGLTKRGIAKAVNALRLTRAIDKIEIFTFANDPISPRAPLEPYIKRAILLNMPKFLDHNLELFADHQTILLNLKQILTNYLPQQNKTVFDTYLFLLKTASDKFPDVCSAIDGILTNPALIELNKYHYEPDFDIIKPKHNHVVGAIEFVQQVEHALYVSEFTDLENPAQLVFAINKLRMYFVLDEILKHLNININDPANDKQIRRILAVIEANLLKNSRKTPDFNQGI